MRRALALKGQRRVDADEHRRACAARHEAVTLGRVGYVRRDGDGPAPVPRGRREPVDGVEQRSRATVARVVRVRSLNVVAFVLVEEHHEVGLDGFGAVDERLGSHVQHANLLELDVVPIHEPRGRCEADRDGVFVLARPAKLVHHQSPGVLAVHAVRLFESRRLDGVPWHVHLDRMQACLPRRVDFVAALVGLACWRVG